MSNKPKFKVGDIIFGRENCPGMKIGKIIRIHNEEYQVEWISKIHNGYCGYCEFYMKRILERTYVPYDSPEGIWLRI